MPRVRIIPVLLLDKGGLYKTIQFKNPAYVGDPVNTVRIFNEKEADELILLDYRASRDKRGIDFETIYAIAGEAFMPMAYGGGIRSFEDARKVFDAGFEKVVLNSILFKDLALIGEIAAVYGAQAVVGSVDIKKNFFGKYKVYTHSGTENTGEEPLAWVKKIVGAGAGEIMVNVIDKDGTWNGYDTGIINELAKNCTVPLIACGGAGKLDDLKKAVEAGASAVAAGSMFVFQKKGMGVLVSFPASFKLEH